MVSTTGAFDVADGGRTYACRVEAPHRGRAEAWWQFGVTGDAARYAARYAPFRAAVDAEASVRPRVVAYHEDRRARRGVPWHHRGDDGRAAAEPARATTSDVSSPGPAGPAASPPMVSPVRG